MKKIRFIGVCIWMAVVSGLPTAAQTGDNLNRGLADLKQKKYRQAETLFTDMIRQQPDNIEIFMLRGEALFFQKDYDKALMDFYRVEQKKPGMASLWIARTYSQTGDAEKAVRALEEHLKSSFRRPESEIKLDTLLLPLENTSAWRALWKKNWYGHLEKGISQARYEMKGGNPETALDGLSRLLNQYPDEVGLWALRGRAYLLAGDLRKAEQDINKALTLQPEDTITLYSAAQLALKKGKYAESAGYLLKLYRKVPARFSLLLKSSDAWVQDGRYKEAMKPLLEYMRYFPEDIEAVFRAGEVAGKMKDYRNALKYLSIVVEKDPSTPVYFVARADMYVRVHTYRYAVDDYAMALDLDPANGDIYFSRAQAYLKMGDTKNACFDLRQALHYGKKEAVPYLQKYCGY
ncbi:MAG TPA: tetratricopeptide repeat protein [Bacteroidetes bacterium]|nr:tetratricopeptide repeat protein [Bacteroidota bacterium]